MNRTKTAITAVIAGAVISAAGIATAGAAGAAPAKSLNKSDVKFLKSNEQVNLAEITLGKIVLKQAEGSRAIKLAHMTIRDHRDAMAKNEAVAKKDGVTLPTSPNAMQKAAATKLANTKRHLSVEYFKLQVPSHKLSIKQTKTEIDNGARHNVTHYAAYYLPVAQMHLHMAQHDLHARESELRES